MALRGLAAAMVGLLTFLKPGLTLLMLVTIFGVYCVINGILTLVSAFRRGRERPRWWSLVLEGVFSLLAGILTLVWPGVTLVGLLFVVALWAIVTGGLQIGTAIELRKQIEGEWVMILGGLLSIVFGTVVFFRPAAGALALSWWLGAYIFTMGIVMGVLAFRLRRHARTADGHPSAPSVSDTAGHPPYQQV
jgi:uncharacterized membrane protein HdeD (DUF308 family)